MSALMMRNEIDEPHAICIELNGRLAERAKSVFAYLAGSYAYRVRAAVLCCPNLSKDVRYAATTDGLTCWSDAKQSHMLIGLGSTWEEAVEALLEHYGNHYGWVEVDIQELVFVSKVPVPFNQTKGVQLDDQRKWQLYGRTKLAS